MNRQTVASTGGCVQTYSDIHIGQGHTATGGTINGLTVRTIGHFSCVVVDHHIFHNQIAGTHKEERTGVIGSGSVHHRTVYKGMGGVCIVGIKETGSRRCRA